MYCVIPDAGQYHLVSVYPSKEEDDNGKVSGVLFKGR